MKLIKFLFGLLKFVLFLLIISTMLCFVTLIKYQNVTMPQLFQEATKNFLVLIFLLSGGIIWTWIYLILFRVMQFYIIFVIAGVGIILCAVSLIKAHKWYKFVLYLAMGVIVVMAIIAFTNAPKEFGDVLSNSSAVVSSN